MVDTDVDNPLLLEQVVDAVRDPDHFLTRRILFAEIIADLLVNILPWGSHSAPLVFYNSQ